MSVKNPEPHPPTVDPDRPPSRFTYEDLNMLMDPKVSFSLPLSVIGFIDLNAFFAQCEQLRLNLPDTAPVVCVQWQSLIAVSYPARKYGINRMDTVASAKAKCKDIVFAHAAAFKKGTTHWQYQDLFPDQSIHKVSLDPYRRELRKILKVLHSECDLVEKASVDESYLDLGRNVYQVLVQTFPELRGTAGPLPRVPDEIPLAWHGHVVGNGGTVCDWDDIIIMIGSQILLSFRDNVYRQLGYTTSGGVARNKRLAKLAGGFLKPDNQTIVPNSSIDEFLLNFELIDITGMGGKTGEIILQKLDTPPDVNSIKYVRENFDLSLLKLELRDDALAEKVYDIVRGNLQQDLVLRTSVKSMMSTKNFVPKRPVNTLYDALDWIKVFVGDLYSRLIELDDENLNLLLLQHELKEKGYIMRPKTLSVLITTTSFSHASKQSPVQIIRSLEKLQSTLLVTAFKVLCLLLEASTSTARLNSGPEKLKDFKLTTPDEVLKKYNIVPLAKLNVVITNFVKTTDSNLIDSYTKKELTQEMKRKFDEIETEQTEQIEQKTEGKATGKKFDSSAVEKLFLDYAKESKSRPKSPSPVPKAVSTFKEDKAYVLKLFEQYKSDLPKPKAKKAKAAGYDIMKRLQRKTPEPEPGYDQNFINELILNRYCGRCDTPVKDVFEHADFHYAADLSEKINRES